MPSPTTGSPTSLVPLTGNPVIDAFVIDSKWGGTVGTGVTITFSFPDADSVWSTIPSDPFGYYAPDPANDNPFASLYHGLDAGQQASARVAFAEWSKVANIVLVEVTETPSLVGDIRVAFTNGGDIDDAYAYAYTPAPFAYAGDVWLNSVTSSLPASANDFTVGANGYNTLIHEFGHAIGLDHPFEHSQFPDEFDSFKYSVMSYSDAPGHQDDGDSSIYPTTPMLFDIRALQYLYGANMSWHAGDDTYVYNEGAEYYETVWDAGGNDTFQYVSAGDGARIDLRAGSFSQLGLPITLASGATQHDNVAIAFNVVIENAVGGDGGDVIVGNSAANVLDGGAGADTMSGGLGNDTYIVDALDTLVENQSQGIDTVRSAQSYVLPATAVENLVLTGAGALNGTGNGLANTLTGNASDNVLDGLGGADTMLGGDGNDTYLVNSTADSVVESGVAGGFDLVFSSASFTLGANLEQLTLTGSGAINATGNADDNTLTGNSGANVLDGGGGNDILAGAAGNDSYIFDAGDTILENANEGLDTLLVGVSYALALAHVENVQLTGAADIDATGDALDNALTGNGGANVLDGGAGNDAMSGGLGNDTYHVAESGDTAVESSAAGGVDLVFSAISFTLGANVENLTLTGSAQAGTGNALANLLTGNSAGNILDGQGGNDVLDGGDGNDLYYVDAAGDTAVEASASGGTDRVNSSAGYVLGANLEELFLIGSGAIDATGNAEANLLTGNDGANVLDGMGGADTLVGGLGNDTYVIDGTDTLIEVGGGGIDTIRAAFSYSLAAAFENLVLSGTGNFDATGNAADNQLTGNAGNNVFNGGAGNDIMNGGAGDDTYYVIESGDLVIETGGGSDTVVSKRDISLGGVAAGVENLTLQERSAALSATGNALDNVLSGNRNDNLLVGGAGNDLLNGLRGADTMAGGAGNDSYFVDNVGDVIIEAAGAGIDTVSSGGNHVLAANVENLILIGIARYGTGNALNNAITGNVRNNVLDGGAGNDRIEGGGGYDTLTGGAGADVFVFSGAPALNIDTVTDFLAADDTLEFDNAIYASLGPAGVLQAGLLRSGAGVTRAADADDFLIYDTRTGALYYDADASGAAAAVQVATLVGAPGVYAADILVS